MNDAILLVDDDVRVVSALQRSLYRNYRIEIAAGAQDALEAINQNTYAVVVSDLQMPGMNGVELLARVRELSPDTVRILLTGHADVEAAIGAVNEGNVFRFLTKPCPQPLLSKTLDAALEQYRLQVAERDVLRETLTGTVAILVQVLSAIQPLAFGRASRVRQYVRLLREEMQIEDRWEYEAAAMLSQLGSISVDPRVLKLYYAGQPLTDADRRHLLSHASVGRKLLHEVPRLQAVSQIIEHQYQNWETTPGGDPQSALIAVGSQLLRTALEFDRLVGTGKTPAESVAAMQRDRDEYHPDVLAALERIQERLSSDLMIPETERLPLDPEQLIFRPIAEQVLRSLRS